MAWPASVGGLPSARRLGTWRRCRHPWRGRRRPRANATAAGLRLSRRGLTPRPGRASLRMAEHSWAARGAQRGPGTLLRLNGDDGV